MRYIQFHPTSLKGNDNPSFLISEAVRDFGAHLLNDNHERFMANYDSRMELATRDDVSNAIANEMLHSKNDNIYIYCRHLESTDFKNEFPTIIIKCVSKGVNPFKDLIPITPAAHYLCGGITVDMVGKTSLKNLFAFGECARTGLHGANRLASNSLLEALVFADLIAKEISTQKIKNLNFEEIDSKTYSTQRHKSTRQQLKKIMSENVGIKKSESTLQIAVEQINKLKSSFLTECESSSYYVNFFERKNMLTVADLIANDSNNHNKGPTS